MLSQPVIGAGYLLRGLKLLSASGVKRFVAIPLAVNVVVFTLLLWVAVGRFGALIDWLMPQLPEWLAWLAWLLWLVFGIAALVVVFFTFSLIANLIAAPFNGLLAEAVERHLTGRAAPDGGSLGAALKAAPAAIFDELRKLGYFIKWALPLLLLFFIPGANLLAPFLWAAFSAWMLAVGYADYPLSNHGLRPLEQRRLLGRRRLLTLGFGGATLFATMVPLVNFLVMPAAVAGAAALYVERLREGEARPHAPERR